MLGVLVAWALVFFSCFCRPFKLCFTFASPCQITCALWLDESVEHSYYVRTLLEGSCYSCSSAASYVSEHNYRYTHDVYCICRSGRTPDVFVYWFYLLFGPPRSQHVAALLSPVGWQSARSSTFLASNYFGPAWNWVRTLFPLNLELIFPESRYLGLMKFATMLWCSFTIEVRCHIYLITNYIQITVEEVASTCPASNCSQWSRLVREREGRSQIPSYQLHASWRTCPDVCTARPRSSLRSMKVTTCQMFSKPPIDREREALNWDMGASPFGK